MRSLWGTVILTSLFFCPTLCGEEAVERAVERGLRYFANSQRQDGSFGAINDTYGGHPAVASLVGMAFLAEGSTPQSGRYAANVNRIVDFLLSRVGEDGLIVTGTPPVQPMYAQGFSLHFLSDCHGATHRPELKTALAKMVQRIATSQNPEGGWRYQPNSSDADLSVTITQLFALWAAKEAAIATPYTVFEKGVASVKRNQNEDGGFRYQNQPGESSLERTAAAIATLQVAGLGQDEETQRAWRYIHKQLDDPSSLSALKYPVYGKYYLALAMAQSDTAATAIEHDWSAKTVREFVETQNDDGSWSSTISKEADTAMILILLQLPKRYQVSVPSTTSKF